ADGFKSSATSCTGTSQGGACDDDPADHCNGTSNTCVDVFKAATTTCRASAGQCDVAEMCTGSSGACPADGFKSSATSCTGTSQGGACDDDPADHCSGTSNTCVDVFKAATTTCRASAGQCDVAEICRATVGAAVTPDPQRSLCRARRGGDVHGELGGVPGGRLQVERHELHGRLAGRRVRRRPGRPLQRDERQLRRRVRAGNHHLPGFGGSVRRG